MPSSWDSRRGPWDRKTCRLSRRQAPLRSTLRNLRKLQGPFTPRSTRARSWAQMKETTWTPSSWRTRKRRWLLSSTKIRLFSSPQSSSTPGYSWIWWSMTWGTLSTTSRSLWMQACLMCKKHLTWFRSSRINKQEIWCWARYSKIRCLEARVPKIRCLEARGHQAFLKSKLKSNRWEWKSLTPSLSKLTITLLFSRPDQGLISNSMKATEVSRTGKHHSEPTDKTTLIKTVSWPRVNKLSVSLAKCPMILTPKKISSTKRFSR